MGNDIVIRARDAERQTLRLQAMHDDCSMPELLARMARGDVEAYIAWTKRAAEHRGQDVGKVLRRIVLGLEVEIEEIKAQHGRGAQ
jgi:hypothetical protein